MKNVTSSIKNFQRYSNLTIRRMDGNVNPNRHAKHFPRNVKFLRRSSECLCPYQKEESRISAN